MTTLDHMIATHQSDWVSFNEEPLFSVPSKGALMSTYRDCHLPQTRLRAPPGRTTQWMQDPRTFPTPSKMTPLKKWASFPKWPPLLALPSGPHLTISNWVQFEDDTPWAYTSPPHRETTLTMPCWTCPSLGSLDRCPLTSESSWTTHSEDTSSPSFGPSYTDLQLISAEEQTSGKASGADSTDNSSSLQEDEEVEMETTGWQAASPAMNGHPAPPVTSARFPSWVAFDDNEVLCSLPPVTSPLKLNTSPVVSVTPEVPYNPTGSFK